ncbi:hypothetical protein F4780DRAFT_307714 [Xylariomycetidae sp. FL0641]|nr:hypothetical protein F4780DRAFT_307714 [Xylariomycetidae sp. FL0641]
MGGLIPLVLPATSSTASSKASSDSAPTELKRRSCLTQSATPAPFLTHRRQQSLPSLRQSKRAFPIIPAPLTLLPSTPAEWKTTITDIKRKYENRRYRSCSTKCCEILDNIRPDAAVEPLYLIYLHFYAASSLEWCARPLSSSSGYRTKLLRDARRHYDEAETRISAAQEEMMAAAERARTRSPSESSSISSLLSPGLSSGASTSSGSTLSSPRTSLFSLEPNEETAPNKLTPLHPRAGPLLRPKKKVSFSGLPDLIEFQSEPYIRPDSPTLGCWEADDRCACGCSASRPREGGADLLWFPKPGAAAPTPVRAAATAEGEEEKKTHQQQQQQEDESTGFDLDAFLQTRSRTRIAAQLRALRAQVTGHRAAVAELLALPPESTVPDLPSLNDGAHPASRPGSRAGSRAGSAMSSRSEPGAAAAAGRDADMQQRIERLRASGWQRKRFDGRRYEVLREQVLGELGP